jgi:hypothetical protein
MILSIPWLIVPLVLYNLIAYSSGDPATPEAVFSHPVLTIPMISGVDWTMTLGDITVAIILAVLFVELVKSTRTTGISIVDHALSMVVFIFCVVEFITFPRAATSVFFILTLVSLIDVIAGFSITIKAARRDLAVGGGDM